jgi:hypothetical protein
MSLTFKILRKGIIDGLTSEQDITNLDIWSDVSKWTPITPFYTGTYLLEITDNLFIKKTNENKYYLISKFCKRDQIFVILDYENYNCNKKVSSIAKPENIRWKLIK